MELQIKNSWADITLQEYQNILKIQQDKNLEDFERDLKYIQVLSPISESELNNLPIGELKWLLQEINFLTKDIAQVDLKEVYEVNDNKYQLTKNIEHITGAQFTDLMSFLKDKEKINENLHWIVAVLMSPLHRKSFLQRKLIKEQYLEKTPLKEIANDMLLMPFSEINSITNFFFALSTAYTATSISYLQTKMNQELQQVLKMLERKEKRKNLNPKEKKVLEQIRLLFNSGASGM